MITTDKGNNVNKKVLHLYEDLIREASEQTIPCTGNGHLFDTDESINIELRKWNEPIAKELCSKCPLVYDCLTYALAAKETHGIWGGTTPIEREQILRNPQKPA